MESHPSEQPNRDPSPIQRRRGPRSEPVGLDELANDELERSLDPFAESPAALNLARLSSDNDLFYRLAHGGFAGKEWESYVAELFKYGYQVLRVWIYNGRMFTECEYRLPRTGSISLDTADDLAMETLGEAIPGFREKVLIPAKWNPELGASLTTFFIGFCKFKFPGVYRRQYRSDARWTKALEAGGQHQHVGSGDDFADPAANVDLMATVLEEMRQLPLKTQELLLYRVRGYDNIEIAEFTGLTVGAVESRLDRLSRRTRTRKQHD